jgi:homoserine kinase
MPDTISRHALIFNSQRVALFNAALASQRHELLGKACRIRVHQAHRAKLGPGLRAAVTIAPEPGLLGVAPSGSGPTVAGLATSNFQLIGERIANCFHRQNLEAAIRVLQEEPAGCLIEHGVWRPIFVASPLKT